MIDFSLYVILDEKYICSNLSNIVAEVCSGGATVIQLREKTNSTCGFIRDAKLVRKITLTYNIPFIINDRVDIALAVNSDGIHLGQTDMPLKDAKKIFNGIMGKSVSNVEEAIAAEQEGATYIGVGCLFPSPTKPKSTICLSTITEIKKVVKIPVLGIGGITLDRVKDVIYAGVDGICVASDIFNYPDIKARTREFRAKIQVEANPSRPVPCRERKSRLGGETIEKC
ncbi:MAG: thiamine phosphate synthase [Candidatus Stahlbacteria bacterium]|nr:thiamine phosphate synthase [Candidatus Stahlbacteria bacterium]